MANAYTVSVKNNNTIQSKTKYAMWPLTGTATPQEVAGDFTLDSTVVAPGVLMAASYNAQCTNRPYSTQINSLCCPYDAIAYDSDARYTDITIPAIGNGRSENNRFVPFPYCWVFTAIITAIPNGTFPNSKYTSLCFPRTVTTIDSDPFGSSPNSPQVNYFIFCHNSKLELKTMLNNSSSFFGSLSNKTGLVFINDKMVQIFKKEYPSMGDMAKTFSQFLKATGKKAPDISKL